MSAKEQGLLAGRYRLQRRVGGGGMGAVWEAHDQLLDRPVAVKMPNRRLASDPSFVERFRREARSAGRLSHPNVAQVYDYGVDRGQPYLVMELVPGETLASRLAREGPLDSDEARRIAADTAEALHAAHEAGVVHRDVKPGNVMITPQGAVKVMDFGIAAAAADGTLTGSGQVLGTPAYMAPEQAAGEGATPASDVYALGVVLYEMLAGRPPFSGDTAVAVASAHVHREPEPLERLVPGADRDLREACMRALAKDPGDRPATASAFATMLRGAPAPRPGAVAGTGATPTEVLSSSRTQALESSGTEVPPPGLPAEPEPTPPAPPGRRAGGRRGVPAWVVAVVALVVVGLLLIVLASTLAPGRAQPSTPPSAPGATISATNPTNSPSHSPSSSATPTTPSPTPTTPSLTPSPSESGGTGLPTPSVSIGA